MKILYIVKQDMNATGKAMLEQHRKDAEVTVIRLTENRDYADIIKQVFSHDKVISW